MPVRPHVNLPGVAVVANREFQDAESGPLHLHQQRQALFRLDGNDAPGINDIANAQFLRMPPLAAKARAANQPVESPPQPPQVIAVKEIAVVADTAQHVPESGARCLRLRAAIRLFRIKAVKWPEILAPIGAFDPVRRHRMRSFRLERLARRGLEAEQILRDECGQPIVFGDHILRQPID